MFARIAIDAPERVKRDIVSVRDRVVAALDGAIVWFSRRKSLYGRCQVHLAVRYPKDLWKLIAAHYMERYKSSSGSRLPAFD